MNEAISRNGCVGVCRQKKAGLAGETKPLGRMAEEAGVLNQYCPYFSRILASLSTVDGGLCTVFASLCSWAGFADFALGGSGFGVILVSALIRFGSGGANSA